MFLLLFFPARVGAQVHQEMGVSCGVANYYGTLQSSFLPTYGYKFMGGVIYKYYMNPYVGIRTGVSYANLTAADSLSSNAGFKARNLSFSTHLWELHAALEINFAPLDILKAHFTPYIFGGISAFYYNPYALEPGGQKVFLRPLDTEGEGMPQYPDRREYSLVNMAFPFGGGLKCLIANKIVLAAEVGFRYTNTGYLDDVSKSYVNLDTLAYYKGPLSKQMAFRGNTVPGWNGTYPGYGDNRGNNIANDWYWFANFTITLYFNRVSRNDDENKIDCPRIFR